MVFAHRPSPLLKLKVAVGRKSSIPGASLTVTGIHAPYSSSHLAGCISGTKVSSLHELSAKAVAQEVVLSLQQSVCAFFQAVSNFLQVNGLSRRPRSFPRQGTYPSEEGCLLFLSVDEVVRPICLLDESPKFNRPIRPGTKTTLPCFL